MADGGQPDFNESSPAEGDRLARLIFYSKFFVGDRLSNEQMFDFSSDSDLAGNKVESLCWRSRCPNDEILHAEGCEIIANQNQARGQPTGPDRRYYVGFREAVARDLVLEKDNFETSVEADPLPGKPYHAHLVLKVKAIGKERAQARSEARSLLGRRFGPVVPHICSGDEADMNHPSKRLGPDWLSAA